MSGNTASGRLTLPDAIFGPDPAIENPDRTAKAERCPASRPTQPDGNPRWPGEK